MSAPPTNSALWQKLLTAGAADLKRARQLFKYLPGAPRCKMCNAPLHGLGRAIVQLAGRSPSPLNPKFCTPCQSMVGANLGGADVPMTVFVAEARAFAAKGLRPGDVPTALARYHRAGARALVDANGFVDQTSDAKVIGAFVPGFAGPDHAPLAASAAHHLLHETGHTQSSGPLLPVGIGTATGVATMGATKDGAGTDVTVSGATVTLAAALAAAARAGEALVSEGTVAAGLRAPERRSVDLKDGMTFVGVLKVVPGH